MGWFISKRTFSIAILSLVFAVPSNLLSQSCEDWNDELNQLLREGKTGELFLTNLQDLVDTYSNIDCSYAAANTWRFIGSTFIELNEYEKAQESFRKSLEYATKSNDELVLGSSYNMMGFIFEIREEFDSSLYYFQSALKSYEKIDDPNNLMLAYTNLSGAYYMADDLMMAYYYQNKLKDLALVEMNEHYLSSADKIEVMLDADSVGIDDNTFIALRKSLNFFSESNELDGQYSAYENMGHCHEVLHNYDSAIYYYSTASLYADSLNSLDSFRWMNEKVTDLSLIVNEQSKNRQLWIYGLVAILSGLSLASFLYYKYRKQKEVIKDKQIDELLSGKEKGFLQAQLEGQEDERKRLAEELHDRLGGMMATLKMKYSAIGERISGLDDDTKAKYSQADELLKETTEEIRRISHGLHSGMLTEYGLRTALEELDEALKEQKETQFHWYFNNMDDRLNSDVELNVFRIVQESISNILKHAKAKEVTVQLSRNNGTLNVMVEDDGKGFDVNKLKKKRGIGLQNMESRVKRINGNLVIDSNPGRGTITIVDIPIKT